ncbi:MAG: DUF4388 domain-containing protein [Planctomycetes bacterium]|nr:DUF4388 domain-containing protein [Planctomycetota bacterium]MCB9912365.1 DUF4388 domain-containing protein [Planctomycetota bacterium]HPF14673.1 DUF4388 domain-containing protein [Planctomycetota bacterium]
MSQSHNQKALESTESAFRRLEKALETFKASERYWRSWERSRDFVLAARRAQGYLELALETLEEPSRVSGDTDPKGWLGRTVKGLAQYLSYGAQPDNAPGDDGETAPASPVESELPKDRPDRRVRTQALEGNSAVVELPDLIGMIRGQAMTGVLNLSLPTEEVQLHFQTGQLVHAYSENAPPNLRLGEILVEQGAITEERLQSLLYCHKSSPQMLGEILLEGGLVEPEHLQRALNHQIQCLFDRLFTYRREAHFRFEPGLPDTTAQRAHVNVLHLLLESARSYDERQAG